MSMLSKISNDSSHFMFSTLHLMLREARPETVANAVVDRIHVVIKSNAYARDYFSSMTPDPCWAVTLLPNQ